MTRRSETAVPINDYLTSRWSPYVFDANRDVDDDDLRALFEAARWTMSSYNAQPWRYIVGVKSRSPETWDKVLSTLLEGNQSWAKYAPVLALGLADTLFEYNGKPNKAAQHDLGAASACLTVEACDRGIHVHQMIGIDPDAVRATFECPDSVEPLTALAIGYAGEAVEGQEDFVARDERDRERRSTDEFILHGEL